MPNLTYEDITAAAARALRALTEESGKKLSGDHQSWWDMGRGVILAWEEVVGEHARSEDKRHLHLLLMDIPSPMTTPRATGT